MREMGGSRFRVCNNDDHDDDKENEIVPLLAVLPKTAPLISIPKQNKTYRQRERGEGERKRKGQREKERERGREGGREREKQRKIFAKQEAVQRHCGSDVPL